jgi:hypothetical protein
MIFGRMGAIPVSLFMDVIDLGVIDVVGGRMPVDPKCSERGALDSSVGGTP